MGRAGFRIIEGKSLLLGDKDVADDERCVITLLGSVRGPRCTTCPIRRGDA